jgi:hypothetical protein
MIVPQMKGLEFEVALWTGVVDLLKRRKKKFGLLLKYLFVIKTK